MYTQLGIPLTDIYSGKVSKFRYLLKAQKHQRMRHCTLKIRYCIGIVALNCILVPIFIRFFSCNCTTREVAKNNTQPMTAPMERIRRRNCTPRKNILFLKTHKTGSSTITNILNRFGESRQLNFVLPKVGQNRLAWPWYFQMDSFHPMNKTKPNILCNHARYNRNVMQKLMPNDTLYITILRDPVTQFESTFSYMTLDKILGMENSTDPLEKFFVDPQSVLVNYVLTQDLRINSDRLKLIRNGMFYDLGLESKDFDNKQRIGKAIEQLDREFDLVMMKEYFDESLILLKRLACLEIDDLVYFNQNERISNIHQTISNKLKAKIRRWSFADVQLYNHYNKTFWKVVKSMGPDFWEEVRLLRYKNKIMKEICLRRGNYTKTTADAAEVRLLKLRHDIPFIARTMCERMTRDEVKYLKELRDIQDRRPSAEKRMKSWSLLSPIHWFISKLRRK